MNTPSEYEERLKNSFQQYWKLLCAKGFISAKDIAIHKALTLESLRKGEISINHARADLGLGPNDEIEGYVK